MFSHFKIDQSNTGLARSSRSVLLVLSGLFLAWIIWNVAHAIPAADDFCYGAGAHERGPIQNVVYEYFNWGGRFSATLLISLFAGADQLLLAHYYLVPTAILVLNLWAAWRFLDAFGLKSRALYVLFAMMLMATFRMRESLFWLAGGATYGVACALLLALIAEQWRVCTGQVRLGMKRTVVLALGALFLAGLNEVASLAHLVIVGLCSLSAVVLQKRNRLIVLVAVAAIIGAATATTAPGNFVRAAATINDSGVVGSAVSALLMLLKAYAAPAVLHTLLFSAFLWACQAKHPSGIQRQHLIGFIACLLVALWAGIFPRAYALHELGPERARTIDFLLLNLAALSAAVLIRDRRRARADTHRPRRVLAAVVWGGAAVLLIGVIAFGRQTVLPLWDGMAESARLRQLMNERIDLARHSAGQSLVVTAYQNDKKPITYFNEIKQDPAQWENACFARYFKLQEVRAR